MKDRVPALGKANRVKITQDNGQIVEGVLSYADEAIEEGSAYCKANVLPDSVCDALGLDRDTAEPKDAFAALHQITFKNAYTDLPGFRKTTQLPTPLSAARKYLAATTVGNYALFGGGVGSTYSAVVDAYEDNPNYLLTLFVPAWYAYALNGAEETVVKADTTLSFSNPTPLNGYLKPATKTYTGQI